MYKRKLSVAQALLHFLNAQFVERDGKKSKFFAGMWGIFGHGNLPGIAQALEEIPSLRYYQARNEQSMVHAAVAYAKQSRRLSAFACTSSIGPGATNMVTAAAGATINRLPVLLVPGDIFACRQRGPVLQQLEHPLSFDVSVNDCLRPVSRFWDRIYRWEQLSESLLEAVRILTSVNETGAVTLCLPQDVQAEAGYFPQNLFEERVHRIVRTAPEASVLKIVVEKIKNAKKPLIIAGGGVRYSEAESALSEFCSLTKIPCVETQAGKAALSYLHEQSLGAVGVTGTECANRVASEADLIIAIGTRMSDFTSASGTQFTNAEFVSVNVDARDANKYGAMALVCDARETLLGLSEGLKGYQISGFYQEDIVARKRRWGEIGSTLLNPLSKESGISKVEPISPLSQAEVLGIINSQLQEHDTVVSAAGSLPGDMHKLLNLSHSQQYHMEYGYSCMGYEIAGALGVKMQKQKGDVFALVGDGSYLMMNTEILTSIQENKKIIIVVFVNEKFACIDNLSKSLGSEGFGNEFRKRSQDGFLNGDFLKVDYAENARSLGADACNVYTKTEFEEALKNSRNCEKSYLIAVHVSKDANVPAFETRWNVPVAETSISEKVRNARGKYESVFSCKNKE